MQAYVRKRKGSMKRKSRRGPNGEVSPQQNTPERE
uniref:40S ribosomal protein S30 n=1 Tax=Heterorhabditis bacteriophora TaxID=37862 RepID=A0A1I7WY21_HETBA